MLKHVQFWDHWHQHQHQHKYLVCLVNAGGIEVEAITLYCDFGSGVTEQRQYLFCAFGAADTMVFNVAHVFKVGGTHTITANAVSEPGAPTPSLLAPGAFELGKKRHQ